MSFSEEIATIALCALATILTRAVPFLVFSGNKPTPPYVRYLGDALPVAIFATLVVYCLKDVAWLATPHGVPELLGIAVTAALHLWKRQFLFSIAGGTIFYMLLVQFVFV